MEPADMAHGSGHFLSTEKSVNERPQAEQQQAMAQATLEESDRVSILLVDDRQDKLLVLETILADLGQNLVMARSGAEALRYLLEQDFAVILLDVNMPGMDGLDTAALIRKRKSSERTPIIFFTSFQESDEQVARGYALGAVDFVFTPIVPEILRAKVSVFVDLFKKTAALIKARAELEIRVQRRTAELAQINEALQAENAIRNRAETHLAERARQLAHINAELEQFAYLASHDLQEPLRMVASYVQLLERKYKGRLDAGADKYISYAVDGAKRMQELIHDLLVYSRAGRADETLQTVSSESRLQEALKNLKLSIEESGAEVTWATLPTVLGDPMQLTQLFQNLIGNSIKYRSASPPKIKVSAEALGREWVFTIQDNGIGIDPRHASRVFRIFQRLHDREKYPGSGIGLAIAKKIVERHGGRIWFESEVGQGATFFFTLPMAAERGGTA